MSGAQSLTGGPCEHTHFDAGGCGGCGGCRESPPWEGRAEAVGGGLGRPAVPVSIHTLMPACRRVRMVRGTPDWSWSSMAMVPRRSMSLSSSAISRAAARASFSVMARRYLRRGLHTSRPGFHTPKAGSHTPARVSRATAGAAKVSRAATRASSSAAGALLPEYVVRHFPARK